MASIVTGGALLSWEPGAATLSGGALLIVGACLCWAIDNNLTRKVSTNDAMLVACLKGLFAGLCNTGLALASGASLPSAAAGGGSLLVGRRRRAVVAGAETMVQAVPSQCSTSVRSYLRTWLTAFGASR